MIWPLIGPSVSLDGMVERDLPRPQTTAILAQSLDGKLAAASDRRPDFTSAVDYIHLQSRVAEMDAVVMGAATLRAYGSTVRIQLPHLLQQRQQQGKPPQPITIICSASGNLDPTMAFFQQPVPRWLWTTPPGSEMWAHHWQTRDGAEADPPNISTTGFDTIDISPDWHLAHRLHHLLGMGIHQLGILGGGQVMQVFLQSQLLDELWVTLCPRLIGNGMAPALIPSSPSLQSPASLQLLECQSVQDEVFLHYRFIHP